MATRLSATDKRKQAYIYDPKKLDLDAVRALVRAKNKDWNANALKDAEHWYRNFLWVAYRYRAKKRIRVGIRRDADEFWHAHILDTEDYAKVCRRLLGRSGFLHHKPSTQDAKDNARVAKASMAAYQEECPDDFPGGRQTQPFQIPCFWHLIW